jgi:multiple sugar transport system ATP-binding protein
VIRLCDLTKVYGDRVVIDNVSLDIEQGEWMVLVGPSGSGKSTILNMIAGLAPITRGHIFVGDREVTELPPQERDIAMVFQNYALYPHMSVRRNLGFGLRMRKTPRAEIDEKVNHVAQLLGLVDLLDRRPAALSGGQRQRVAMGRAIAREPKAFLLDEPLSNLDAKLRVHVRAELIQLRGALGTTTVYVTHDQVEAMTLGHRVAVLNDGVLQQVASGRELFEHPANSFVATFIGSPSMNLCRTRFVDGKVTLGSMTVSVPVIDSLSAWRDREVLVGVRPTDLEADMFDPDPSHTRVTGVVKAVEELGAEKMVMAEVRCLGERCSSTVNGDRKIGTWLMQARVDARTPVEVGKELPIAVDPNTLYFFDPDGEEAIAWPNRTGRPSLAATR